MDGFAFVQRVNVTNSNAYAVAEKMQWERGRRATSRKMLENRTPEKMMQGKRQLMMTSEDAGRPRPCTPTAGMYRKRWERRGQAWHYGSVCARTEPPQSVHENRSSVDRALSLELPFDRSLPARAAARPPVPTHPDKRVPGARGVQFCLAPLPLKVIRDMARVLKTNEKSSSGVVIQS